METISTGAYRNAVADGTVAELDEHGYAMRDRPVCHSPRQHEITPVLEITCRGETTDRRPVIVTGRVTAADTRRPREHYIISVAGRVVVQQHCLGLGCNR